MSMTVFTQGLYPFEVVLLFGGIALLVILLVGLVAGLVRGKIPALLVPLFIISIVMIAYPSVQSIKYQDLMVTLNNQLQQVLANPTEQNSRTSLAQVANQVASRPTTNPATIAALANAQYALGEEKTAQESLTKALQLDPAQPAAIALKNKITSVEKLRQLSSEVQRNPESSAAKQQLAEVTAQVSKMPLANPKAMVLLATAQKLTGNEEAAQTTAKKAMAINPSAFKLEGAKP
jgi:tetratricopeptide (TPR) repeat protein